METDHRFLLGFLLLVNRRKYAHQAGDNQYNPGRYTIETHIFYSPFSVSDSILFF
jgi:hypothetical protein